MKKRGLTPSIIIKVNPEEFNGLGNLIKVALNRIGITEKVVTTWLGENCKCDERRKKLNALTYWVKSLVSGRINKEQIENLMEEYK